jgi:hypothetical protein
MGRTVAELEASLSASEWLDWLRYFALEPYGAPALDVIQAQLRSLIANIHRNEKARSQPFEAREFLLFSQIQEEQEAVIEPLHDGLSAQEWQLALTLRAWQERHEKRNASAQ